jgi:hypothetical protein
LKIDTFWLKHGEKTVKNNLIFSLIFFFGEIVWTQCISIPEAVKKAVIFCLNFIGGFDLFENKAIFETLFY